MVHFFKKKDEALLEVFQEVWQYRTHFGEERLASLIRLEPETYPARWKISIGVCAESWTPV